MGKTKNILTCFKLQRLEPKKELNKMLAMVQLPIKYNSLIVELTNSTKDVHLKDVRKAVLTMGSGSVSYPHTALT